MGAFISSPLPPVQLRHDVQQGPFALRTLLRFNAVGSEVARTCVLATVRRPNRTCSFPAYGFHEDSLFGNDKEGINRTKFTSPYCSYNFLSGSCFQPVFRHR